MNKLHRKKVVSRWSADHLLTTYQPSTHHLPTTNDPFVPWWISCKTVDFTVKQTSALSTLKTNHLPTTYQPLTDHLPTIYRPLTDHLPTTYRPLTDHFFTVQLVLKELVCVQIWVHILQMAGRLLLCCYAISCQLRHCNVLISST